MEKKMTKAVVVLSGGQDSTTCLYWAKTRFDEVKAITFDYGQRHASEIDAAEKIARLAGVEHMVFRTPFGSLSPSALTRKDIEVKADGGLGGLPSTFTPGRNLVFLTLAASWAIGQGIRDIVTGVCETDYSGYPDCRLNTINALAIAIALGNDCPDFRIHTPLMHLTKAETVKLARTFGDAAWRALGETVTCYQGYRPGCGKCPACVLRANGFEEAGLADPAAQ